MRRGLSRRDFVKSTTSGAVAAAALSPIRAAEGVPAPAIIPSTGARPIIIASANGNFHRNGGTKTCVETAFALMMQGTDVLEALIAGVNIVELDPEDTSVGYGGLPNAAGVVQLDACCMHGPTRRAGGVAALEGVRTPSKVAHAVMENTDHHLLVGPGAQEFARNMGFQIEADLNTKRSRQAWLEWKHPKNACLDALRRIRSNTIEKRLRRPDGNPNFNVTFYALNAKGEHAAVSMYAENDDDRGWAGQVQGRQVRYAVCTENGAATLACDALIPGALQDQ